MIIDCEAAIVLTRCPDRVRYSRAKVGIGSDKTNNCVLIVITSSIKEKFKICDNCKVRSVRCEDMSATISFEKPQKDLFLRNCDRLLLKSFISLVTKILKKELIPKLANISVFEKMKPKPTSLTLKDNNFSASDLSNKCLQRLSCDNFRLIPRLVWKLNNLRELQLISCELTQIPIQLYDLGLNLRVLDISKNDIHFIDGSFVVSMRRLTSLDLNHNKLEALPYEIKLMTSLEELNLSYNQLSHLPNTLGKISSLKRLNLSHNRLNGLSYHLFKNRQHSTPLQKLDIAENPLKEQKVNSSPIVVKSFPTLKTLSSCAVLSSDNLLYSCHKFLPQYIYKNIVTNGDNCAICSRVLVDKDMQMSLIHMSLEAMANDLITSRFPTYPMVPTFRYVCHFCIHKGWI